MNENKVKKFWKDHKREIIIGVVCATGGIILCAVTGKCIKATFKVVGDDGKRAKENLELLMDIAETGKGASMYIPVELAEFDEIGMCADGVSCLMDKNGLLLKPISAIVFGNEIKE